MWISMMMHNFLIILLRIVNLVEILANIFLRVEMMKQKAMELDESDFFEN